MHPDDSTTEMRRPSSSRTARSNFDFFDCGPLSPRLCGTGHDASFQSAMTRVVGNRSLATVATSKSRSTMPASDWSASDHSTGKVSASQAPGTHGSQPLDAVETAEGLARKVEGMLRGLIDGKGQGYNLLDNHRKKVQTVAKEGYDARPASQAFLPIPGPHRISELDGTIGVIDGLITVPVTLMGANPVGVFFTCPHLVASKDTDRTEDMAFDRVLTRHAVDEHIRDEIRKTDTEVSVELLMEAIRAVASPTVSSIPLVSSSERQVWATYTEDRTKSSHRSRSLQRVVGYILTSQP